MGCVDHSPANNGELRVMTVVAGAAPTALWHTAHCRLCEPVWATGRRACRAGCLGLSMFCPFCRVCVRCYGGCTDLDLDLLDRTSGPGAGGVSG